jgi:hypothetical protein
MEDSLKSKSSQLLYFAYGTLLGATHMRSRYPSAVSQGLATYDAHELGFSRYEADSSVAGGCTIVDAPGSVLIGVLYELNEADMTRLLAVDGESEWYERREVDVVRASGGRVRAVTLRVKRHQADWIPPVPYGHLVTEGAREAGLPIDYQERLSQIVVDARGLVPR